MMAVMMLSQHRVLSSFTVRPRAPYGARCMGHVVRFGAKLSYEFEVYGTPGASYIAKLAIQQRSETLFVQCAWTNGITQDQSAGD